MYRIFKESFGSRAGNYLVQDTTGDDVERELAYNNGLITYVTPAAGTGPSWSAKYANQNILSTMQAAATASEAKNVPVFFGVEQPSGPGGGQLQFFARTNVWGTDRTTSGITLSRETQTLNDACFSWDWSKYLNRIYCADSNVDQASGYSIVDTSDLTATLAADPFALFESYSANKDWDLPAEREDGGQAILGRQQIEQVSCTLIERDDFKYGCQWTWGDKVAVQDVLGNIIQAYIAGVHFSGQNGAATITADVTPTSSSGYVSGAGRLAHDIRDMQREIARLAALLGQ